MVHRGSKLSSIPLKPNPIEVVSDTLEETENVLHEVVETADRTIDPIRQSLARRYPTLFLLAVTFGVAAVFFGFERVLGSIDYLNERPWLILALGILVLIITGRLYKKLQ